MEPPALTFCVYNQSMSVSSITSPALSLVDISPDTELSLVNTDMRCHYFRHRCAIETHLNTNYRPIVGVLALRCLCMTKRWCQQIKIPLVIQFLNILIQPMRAQYLEGCRPMRVENSVKPPNILQFRLADWGRATYQDIL